MKISLIDGCNFILEINGKEFGNLSEKEQIEVCTKILHSGKCSDATMQDFVERFVEVNGKVTDLGFCEQCYSQNYKYTIEIDG